MENWKDGRMEERKKEERNEEKRKSTNPSLSFLTYCSADFEFSFSALSAVNFLF